MSPMVQDALWREEAGADGDSEDKILEGLAALDDDDNSAAAAVAAAEAAAEDEDEEEEPTTNTFILIRHGRNKPKHLKLAALLSALGLLWTAAKAGRLVEMHRSAKATQSAPSTKELQQFEALAAVLQQQLQHQQAGAAEASAEALQQLQQLQQVQQDTHELLRQRQQNLKAQALVPVEGTEDPEALAGQQRLQQSMQQRDASTLEVDVDSSLTGLTEETAREMLQQLQQTHAKLTEEEEHADLELERFKAAAPILAELQQQLHEAREEVGKLEAASTKRESLVAASDELDEQQQQLLLVQLELQQQLEEREKRRLARQQQLEAKRAALLKEREDVGNQLSLLKEKHSALKAAACNEELQKELEEEQQLQQRQQQLALLQQSLQRLLQRDSPAKDAALQQQLGSEAAAEVQQLRPEVQQLLQAQVELQQQKMYRGRVTEAERTVQQQQRQLDRLRVTLKERMSFPGSFGAARHIQLSVHMKIWESLLNKTADQQQEEWYRAQRNKTLMRQRLTGSSGTATHLAALQAACKNILAARGGIAEARRERNRQYMVEELQQLGVEALLEEAAAGRESAVVQQIAESMWEQQQKHTGALKQLQEHSEQQVIELLQQMHIAEKPSAPGAPLGLFYQVAGLIKEASKQEHFLKELELLHGRSRSQLVQQAQDLLLLALETARTRSSSSSMEEGEEEALKAMSRAHVDALEKEEQKHIMWETRMEQLEERYSTDLLQQTAADRSKKNKQKKIIREATEQLHHRKPLVLTTSTKPEKETALQTHNNTKTQQQKQLLRQQKKRQPKQRQQQQRPKLGGDRPRGFPAASKVSMPTFKVSPSQSAPLSHWETGPREAGWKGWISVEAGSKEAAMATMMMETAKRKESTIAARETDSEETESRQTGLRKTGMGETVSAIPLPSMLTPVPAPATVATAREAAKETEEETAQKTAGKEAAKETTKEAEKIAIEREAAEETAGQSGKEATEEEAAETGEVMLKIPSLPTPPTRRARWGVPTEPLEAFLGVAAARGDSEDEETTEEWREASDERERVQEEDTTKEEDIFDTTEEDITETGDEGKAPTPAVPVSMQLMIQLLEDDEGSNPQQETSVPSTPLGSPPSSPTGSSWESHLVPFGLNMKELYYIKDQQLKGQTRQTRARTRSRSGPGSRPRSGSGPGSQGGSGSGTGWGASSESGWGTPSGSQSESPPASEPGMFPLRRASSMTALKTPSTVHMSSSRSPSRSPSRHSISRSSSPSASHSRSSLRSSASPSRSPSGSPSASPSRASSRSSSVAAAAGSPPASSSSSSSSFSSASPSNSSPRPSPPIFATPSAAPHTQSPEARRRNSFTTTQSLQQLQQLQQQQPQSPGTSRRQPQAKAAPPTGRHSNSRWRP